MSVAKSVEEMIESRPFLSEALVKNLINFNHLAAYLREEIERKLGKEVKEPAIVMALRRYSEKIKSSNTKSGLAQMSCSLSLQTNICDFNLKKNLNVLGCVGDIGRIAAKESKGFINTIIGNKEVAVTLSSSLKDQFEEGLNPSDILTYSEDLVAITLTFSGDFLATPGIVFQTTRMLAWEHINVYEIVSTMNELTFVVKSSDSPRALGKLQFLTLQSAL